VDNEHVRDAAVASPTGLRMEYDIRDAGPTQSVVVVAPTNDDVIAALHSLHQSQHTEVTLEDATVPYSGRPHPNLPSRTG
jgi:hypothetical protein